MPDDKTPANKFLQAHEERNCSPEVRLAADSSDHLSMQAEATQSKITPHLTVGAQATGSDQSQASAQTVNNAVTQPPELPASQPNSRLPILIKSVMAKKPAPDSPVTSVSANPFFILWLRILATVIDALVMAIPTLFATMLILTIISMADSGQVTPLWGELAMRSSSYSGQFEFFFKWIMAIIYAVVSALSPTILPLVLSVLYHWGAQGFAMIALLSSGSVVVNLLYHASLESSKGQATIGQQLVGLAVCDSTGYRISWLQAAKRFLLKAVAVLFLPITVIALFWDQRRLLHDDGVQHGEDRS